MYPFCSQNPSFHPDKMQTFVLSSCLISILQGAGGRGLKSDGFDGWGGGGYSAKTSPTPPPSSYPITHASQVSTIVGIKPFTLSIHTLHPLTHNSLSLLTYVSSHIHTHHQTRVYTSSARRLCPGRQIWIFDRAY